MPSSSPHDRAPYLRGARPSTNGVPNVNLQATIDEIRQKQEESRQLLAELEVWARIIAQGIDHNEVESLGIRKRLLKHHL